jgi:hypothetical protein
LENIPYVVDYRSQEDFLGVLDLERCIDDICRWIRGYISEDRNCVMKGKKSETGTSGMRNREKTDLTRVNSSLKKMEGVTIFQINHIANLRSQLRKI